MYASVQLSAFLFFLTFSPALTNPTVSIQFPQNADYDFHNDTFAFITNAHAFFDLICTAPYPIQWIGFYEPDDDGTSESDKWAETRRIVKNFSDPETYEYTAVLALKYAGKLQIFANFSCQSVSEPKKQTNVLMTSENMKNVIILEITNRVTLFKPKGYDSDEKPCEITVTGSKLESNPCWKCETNEGDNLELDFYNCETPIQCNLYYQSRTREEKCLKIIDEQENTTDCKTPLIDYNPRMIACKNRGIQLVQFTYYSVVPRPNRKNFVYFNWNEIDTKEMVYIRPFREELYVGEELTVICEMSRYYFSFGVWFAQEINGTIIFMEGIEPQSRVETRDDPYDESGTFLSNATFQLVPGLTKVHCFAPIWNTEKWVESSVDVHVQEATLPIIADTGKLTTQSSVSFTVGDKDKFLRCGVGGKPVPEVTWSGPHLANFVVQENLTQGWSQILFKEVTHTLDGEYVYKATSFIGSDSRKFMVEVSDGYTSALAISAGVIIPIAIGLIIIIFYGWRKIRQQKIALRILTEKEIQEFVEGNPKLIKTNEYLNVASAIEALSYDKNKYEIPMEYLKIDMSTLLGSGAFGVVYKGTVEQSPLTGVYQNVSPSNCPVVATVQVAIKTVKRDVDVDNFKALLSEIKIMAYIGAHQNIVNLIGANTQNIRNRQAYIAVELCERGSLESYLRNYRSSFVNHVEYGELKVKEESQIPTYYINVMGDHVSTFDITKWAYDIARGMGYLHERKVIHGDLATRNVLLNSDAVAKIGDFGLSRQLVNSSNYFKKSQCPLPWKWMAPESLQEMNFSVQSDIWAFGVTLWEIFSLADVPYKGLAYNSEFLKELEGGMRLHKPIFATNNIYEYMLKCWSYQSKDRPEFKEFKLIGENILKDIVPEGYFVGVGIGTVVPTSPSTTGQNASTAESNEKSGTALDNNEDYEIPITNEKSATELDNNEGYEIPIIL